MVGLAVAVQTLPVLLLGPYAGSSPTGRQAATDDRVQSLMGVQALALAVLTLTLWCAPGGVRPRRILSDNAFENPPAVVVLEIVGARNCVTRWASTR